MAEGNEKRATYPSIPVRNWWDLRRKFKETIPRQVNSDYLTSVLAISAKAARNLIPPLRVIGLIDDDGKPRSLANDWRSDEHYPQVCRKIREQIYPSGLLDAFPPPKPDRKGVTNWFFRNTGTGMKNAMKMAAFYLLLCEADPSVQDASVKMKKDRKLRLKRTTIEQAVAEKALASDYGLSEGLGTPFETSLPSIHIDIQIHIAADAKPEQIEQVFASMAKYLYGRNSR